MADDSERDDPVLVRPYITTQPGSTTGPADRPTETWPATADLPEDGTREMPGVSVPRAVPAGAAAKTTALRRQRLLVLAALGVLALVGGGALFLLLPSGDDNPPAVARPTAPAPRATGSAGVAPVASAGTVSVSPSGTTSSRPAGATRPAGTTGPAAAAPAPTATSAPGSPTPTATLAPPPGTDRTGAITAAGGRCLSLGGLLALDGTPVQTAGCSGTGAQRWTLTPDGTMQVANRCARVAADATVRIDDCDDRSAAQWRAGPGGSLVNPETGRCLTDPGRLMATVTVTECTGAADQTWTLP